MPASELLINVESTETRAALIEEGIITELHVERNQNRSLVGNIYYGKVGRVLRGMQAAFVDIGLERHAFLQVGDAVRTEDLDGVSFSDTISDEGPVSRRVSKQTPIGQVLKAGQGVLVQVSRAPVGKKGARVTSHISLAGRHLVFLPTLDQIGVSRRIRDDSERKRLRSIVDQLRTFGGFIVRTEARDVQEEILEKDIQYLVRLWADILDNRSGMNPPALIYQDLDLVLRVARDLLGHNVQRLVVDEKNAYERLKMFVGKFFSNQAIKISFYSGDEPIFDAFGIEEEFQRALTRVIPLPSGGSLVFDYAEALTAIDVNTGRYSGGKDLEETITQTNLEAVKEIAYQLRLRNIGGLIVVDFIDMDKPSNRERVNQALRDALKDDRAQTTAVRISELGLVEMTRKGANQSLHRQFFEPCFYCEGKGQIKSRTTVCGEILRDLKRRCLELRSPRLVVECHPRIAEVLSRGEENKSSIGGLERRFGKKIEIIMREDFHWERYDIKGGREYGA